MAQFEMSLHDYWLIVRRRRLIIIASTVLVALLAFWFSRQRTPVYESTASVRYEQSTSLTGLLVEVLAIGGGDNVETQGQVIKSYPVLEAALRKMGKLPERPAGSPMRESRAYLNALDALGSKIRTQRVAGTTIIEIIATSSNPTEAREIADIIAETYRDYNRSLRNARIIEARKYIEKQLEAAEARVKRSEEQVWAFREANAIITPGAESGVLLSMITQLRGSIELTRQQRTEIELAQTRLGRFDPASFTERIFVDTTNPAIQRLQTTQIDLLLEYSNLSLEVTDRHPRLQALIDRMREVRTELRRELGAQMAMLRTREEILTRQMGEVLQKNKEMPAVELGLQRLQRDAKTNEDLLLLLRTKYQEALIKESERIEEVSIVRPATDPVEAVAVEGFNTVLIGALLGLLLGVVVAFVQETLDTSIGTIEDVETYLQVPVLGILPHIDPRPTIERLIERRPALAQIAPEMLHSHAMLVTHFDPKSPAAEAYRTLRTNLQFIQRERNAKAIVFTSPTRQEGKSTTIVNVAITMAQNGQRTLLVGANMRRPSIHRFFGIEREPGLSDILVGHMQWRECIRTVADILMGRFEMEDIIASPGLDNLHIIESGAVPANPSELLSAPTMGQFLREVREEYDVILIDTPPTLPVTDSAIVAAQTDGVVLVYQSGKVGRLVLRRAKSHLESAHASVWGVVLNDVQVEVSGYTHYSTRYYGEESSGKSAGRAGRFWGWLRSRRTRPESARNASTDEMNAPPRRRPAARGGYRNILGGAGLVLLLLAALGGIAAWHRGWLSGVEWPWRFDRPPSQAPAPGAGPTAPPAPTAAAPAPVAESAVASVPSPPGIARGETPVRETAPRESGVKEASSVAKGPRFTLELGPFLNGAEAARTERQLNESGHQTVRVRQQTGAVLYAVLIERMPGPREAQTVVSTLREQGFPDAIVLGGGGALNVRVGEPVLLRAAVQRADSLRAKGHEVRVAAQPGEAQTLTIRHGNFASRDEAEAKSADLARLGLPNHVVRDK